jgi:hypothetical protein
MCGGHKLRANVTDSRLIAIVRRQSSSVSCRMVADGGLIAALLTRTSILPNSLMISSIAAR